VNIDEVMRLAPVIPVLVIEKVTDARPIAEALVDAGLPVLEVTLRTPAALEVIRAMSDVDGAVVGAGTVLDERQLEDSFEAGAQFIVSPGLTEPLTRAAIDRRVPFLPGIANASDIMRGLNLGLDRFKFFPAEAAGGIKALKALAAPFGNVQFCPTGGITQATAADWLTIPQVLCVGGTWLVPPGPLNPEQIRDAAGQAAALRTLDR
jgi:2-dehydro-3-deoxyphosphogluconate aldolase/(4S)-4-hydroxy-2-oxoglutarate aldolase